MDFLVDNLLENRRWLCPANENAVDEEWRGACDPQLGSRVDIFFHSALVLARAGAGLEVPAVTWIVTRQAISPA